MASEVEQDRRPEKRARHEKDQARPVGNSWLNEYEKRGGGAGSRPVSSHAANGTVRGCPSPPWREDDKDGHYMFELGENITPRYKILSQMGEGTFGRVLECWDRESQEYVAIKVIRNIQKYRDAAKIEIDVLHELAKHDRSGSKRCVQLKDWFDYRNHICIVCERLGPSLYDFVRKNDYQPFPMNIVRHFSHQLLTSVEYMHGLTLIHTDLKPENILLVSSDYIKIPDYKDLIMQYVGSSAGPLIDLLQGLLKFDPVERLTAKEALRHPFFKDPW